MTLDLGALSTSIRANLYNPQNIFSDSLELFEDATNGALVPVDTTNPFVNLLMWMSSASAISNDQIERSARRMLPEYANTRSELAPHFDYDTLQTIYATPSTCLVTLVLPLDEVIANATPVADGSSYLIIPREATFTYTDGTVFSLHYHIRIHILSRETIDIYTIPNENILMGIKDSIYPYTKSYKKDSNWNVIEYINIPITAYQYSSTSHYRAVSTSSGFSEVFTLSSQLYHVRVTTTVNGEPVEFLTAHGDFKYSPNATTPIIIMQYLTDNTIRLKIPDVFITNGLVGAEILIEILETSGQVDTDMLNDGTFNFTPEFTNTDSDVDAGVSALRQILNLGAYATNDPSGGVDTPTLEELRTRVIVGDTDNAALSEAQLEASLEELGYTLSHELNYIGKNVFTAIGRLADYNTGDINTTIGGACISITLNDLIDKKGVIFPIDGCAVITPYAIIDGTVSVPAFLTYTEVENLNALDSTSLISKINNDNLLTPIFYYLIDTTTDTPLYGAFDLDNPSILTTDYMESNLQNSIKMATTDIYIKKVDGSYFVYVLTAGNDLSKDLMDEDVSLQLTTTDEFGSIYSVNSTLISRTSDGDYLFKFELQTGFNISMDGTIEILNFYNPIHETYDMPLESLFKINYILTATSYISADTTLQDNINDFTLAESFSVITIEETTITLGKLLESLFTPIKSSPGAVVYEKHVADIPALWPSNVLDTDDFGKIIFTVNPDYDDTIDTSTDNPKLLTTQLHAKGDPILKDNGDAEYSAYAGDNVRDTDGELIEVDTGSMNHTVVVQCLDYKFNLIGYLSSIQSEVKSNVQADIDPLLMIQDTYLRYMVGNTVGEMDIIIDGDSSTTISNEITMTISVVVSEDTYNDGTLRSNITALIKKAVASHFTGNNYVEYLLVNSISSVIGSSVISFKIDEVSTLGTTQSFSLVNTRDSMGIKSVLSISDTGVYEILDGITVNYISF